MCSSLERRKPTKWPWFTGPLRLKGAQFPVCHKSVSASKSVQTAVYGSPSSSASVSMTDLYWWLHCSTVPDSDYSHAPLTQPPFPVEGETRSCTRRGEVAQLCNCCSYRRTFTGHCETHFVHSDICCLFTLVWLQQRSKMLSLRTGSSMTEHSRIQHYMDRGQTDTSEKN